MYKKIAIPLWLLTIFGPETYLLFTSGYAGWKFAVAVGIYLVQVAAMAGCVWLLSRPIVPLSGIGTGSSKMVNVTVSTSNPPNL